LNENGTTILLVSHSPDTIRAMCNKAILLVNGEVISSGEPEKVIESYISMF